MNIGSTVIYLQVKMCRQFRFLIYTSFFGQFVHAVGGEGMGYRLPAASSILSEYMIICHIQVIIYGLPFPKVLKYKTMYDKLLYFHDYNKQIYPLTHRRINTHRSYYFIIELQDL